MTSRSASDLLQLMRLDTLGARNDLYLRVLYSPACASLIGDLLARDPEGIPARTRSLLQGLAPDLLALEQAARLRSLRRHLLRAIPSLEHLFSAEVLSSLVAAFAESSTFWQGRGRTLAEGFCLVCGEQREHPISPLVRDLVRLLGTIHGLAAAPEAPSPWPPAQGSEHDAAMLPGALAAETFLSDYRLLDEHGALPALELHPDLEEAFPRAPSRVVICALPARRMVAFNLEV